MHSEWHLDIEKPLFHLYKNPVQCGKQRTPVSPESQPQYCKCARDGTAFCHNLSDAVRQRFAAYYPGRKTQRERSATTGSAGVMRILSCCSHNQPAEVEEKSFLPAFFYGIYSVANLVCSHILRFSQNHSFISTNPLLITLQKQQLLSCPYSILQLSELMQVLSGKISVDFTHE